MKKRRNGCSKKVIASRKKSVKRVMRDIHQTMKKFSLNGTTIAQLDR